MLIFIYSKASLGTQLLNALLGWETPDEILPYKTWYSGAILEYILKDNASAKQLVLKIPLEVPKPGKGGREEREEDE